MAYYQLRKEIEVGKETKSSEILLLWWLLRGPAPDLGAARILST